MGTSPAGLLPAYHQPIGCLPSSNPCRAQASCIIGRPIIKSQNELLKGTDIGYDFCDGYCGCRCSELAFLEGQPLQPWHSNQGCSDSLNTLFTKGIQIEYDCMAFFEKWKGFCKFLCLCGAPFQVGEIECPSMCSYCAKGLSVELSHHCKV